MSITPGFRIGPYEIVGSLEAGGMGEVYRATDTNLKRQVAIKVLPPSMVNDTDRLARFQREAEVLASLSHPNIAAIYGLERASGQTALVMELVEGPTLAEILAGSGLSALGSSQSPKPKAQSPLSINDAVAIAKQIADALDAAHEQGIIHRDLKPANIKVRPDGGVKVLDFGLAKAIEGPVGAGLQTGPQLSQSPTITSPAMTRAGVILGTAAYMSPEQARGKRLDKRTDIWAFGCVLYEMLTGRGAFAADDVVATLAAVVKDQPDWNALPADTPAPLRRLLLRLLEKDSRKRVRDIGDVRLELDALESPDTSRDQPPSPRRRSVAPGIIAAGLAGVIAGGIAAWIVIQRRSGAESPRVLRVSVRLPPDQRIVSTADQVFNVAISPDGTRLVYAANGRLYLRPLDAAESTTIPNAEQSADPFFSPDGQAIGFVQDDKLVKLPLSGGVPLRLADVNFFTGARWGDDGAIVFADANSGIHRVVSTGGPSTLLVAAESGQVVAMPDVLPGSEWVLYTQTSTTTTDFETIAYSLKTREHRVVVKNGPARYLSSGHLLYGNASAGVFVAPFDAARAQLTGPAVAIPRGVDNTLADVSRTGTLVSTNVRPDVRRIPVWLTRDGKETPLPIEPGPYRFPRLSPDGVRLAISRAVPTENTSDVWLYNIDGSSRTRFTFDGQSAAPVWTSDGRRLAFSTFSFNTASQGLRLFVQDADGTGRPKLLAENRNSRFPYAWIAGNKSLLFTELHENALDVGVMDVADGTVRMLLTSPANESRPHVSPDGQWLAYSSNESGRDEIYVRPLVDIDSGKWQVSTGGGHSPVWVAGGHELVFRAPGHMMSVAVRPGTPFRFDAPRTLFDDTYVNDIGGRSYDVAPDGRFLMLRDQANSADQIEIVVNWFEELKRLMQTKRTD